MLPHEMAIESVDWIIDVPRDSVTISWEFYRLYLYTSYLRLLRDVINPEEVSECC